MYDPSSNLAPLGVSPELIACAIGLRFEYVGVTVLEPFWLCPEENLHSFESSNRLYNIYSNLGHKL